MESWREVWRKAFGRVLPLAGLRALADALRDDDPRLRQGNTTCPPPLMCVSDWPCEGACALGFTGWQNADDPLATVGEVEEHFAAMCFQADQLLGEPAGCGWFLNWFDDTPRDVMRADLLPEVERAIAERESLTPAGD